MNSKQNIILSLDDLVLNLPKLKDKLWDEVLDRNKIETSLLFKELCFDANHEKIEKLSREYPRYAPYIDEVNISYEASILSFLENYQVEASIIQHLDTFSKDFDLSFLTNLSLDNHALQQILKQFNFTPKAIFSTKEVLSAKPDADIYLKIARKFNIKPHKLITVDATINGVQAGYLANTKAIYVATNYPISQWAIDYSIAFLNGFKDLETTLYTWLKDQSE